MKANEESEHISVPPVVDRATFQTNVDRTADP
jgi:hypothetical protein